jgi:hypothetical protein
MRYRVDKYARPIRRALDLLDLKTDVRIRNDRLGLLSLGREDVDIRVDQRVVNRDDIRNIVVSATEMAKVLRRDQLVDLIAFDFFDVE